MNRLEKGSITLGASLLGAVLVAVPMLAKNVFTSPKPVDNEQNPKAVVLTPIQLENQNNVLRDEIKTLKTELTKYKLSAVFTRDTLKQGDKGSDVKGLQLFLGAIPDIYPDDVQNGIYGASTEKAVRTFQDREGLEVNGKVDEKTMAKIFDLVTSSELEDEHSKIEALLASSTSKTTEDVGDNEHDDPLDFGRVGDFLNMQLSK